MPTIIGVRATNGTQYLKSPFRAPAKLIKITKITPMTNGNSRIIRRLNQNIPIVIASHV